MKYKANIPLLVLITLLVGCKTMQQTAEEPPPQGFVYVIAFNQPSSSALNEDIYRVISEFGGNPGDKTILYDSVAGNGKITYARYIPAKPPSKQPSVSLPAYHQNNIKRLRKHLDQHSALPPSAIKVVCSDGSVYKE